MSRRNTATAVQKTASLLILGCALLVVSATTAAQNSCPKDEIFGGYSWLAPNWGDLDYKINNIPNAFDASNTYYLPNVHNLGLVIDGSGHFKGGTTPPNLANGSEDSTAVGYALGGLQYKFHSEKLSPFLRGFLGGASISPDCCHGNEWSFAAGGGGGLDLTLNRRFSLRLIQADYIYSSYSHVFPSTHPTAWNSVRLAAGLVISLGNYCSQQPVSCSVSSSPSEVFAGEPVRLSASGVNFIPNHNVTYAWKSTGGKLSSASTQATEVDTTGLAPGTYNVSATLTDPKMKKMNSATCPAVFIVKPPHVPVPPTVTCTANPTTVVAGRSSVITLNVTNPENLPLTYAWSTTAGLLTPNGTSATLTPRNNQAGSTVTVTATATDNLSRAMSVSCPVTVPPLPPPCVPPEEHGKCTFVGKGQPPARVDNDCKDVLDGLATALQQKPGDRLVIVGYSDASETQSSPTIGAQRAENVKYYLTKDGATKIDADRIEAQQAGTDGKLARFYFIPQGTVCPPPPDLGTAVDEATVKGHTRKAPPRQKKAASGTPSAQ